MRPDQNRAKVTESAVGERKMALKEGDFLIKIDIHQYFLQKINVFPLLFLLLIINGTRKH